MDEQYPPAGPELDALIAERVMNEQPGKWQCQTGCCHGWRPLAAYSRDIAAAWLVVERLAGADGLYRFGLWMNLDGCRAGFWRHDMSVHDREDIATAPTAPEAICRAALMALAMESTTA